MNVNYYGNCKRTFAALLIATAGMCGTAMAATVKPYLLASPNGKTSVEITTGDALAYSVLHDGQTVLAPSAIGLQLQDGTSVGTGDKVVKAVRRKAEEQIAALNYRFDTFTVTYNELDLRLKSGFGVRFRAYDEGVAYRFYNANNTDCIIENELAMFNFDADYTAYLPYTTSEETPMAMAYQNVYHATPLSGAEAKLAFLPVSVDCGAVKLTLLESDLEAYPGMFLQKAEGNALQGVFAPYPAQTEYNPWRHQEYVTRREPYIARSEGARDYPWRVLAVTERDTDMPVNNLVYALASPNRIGDTSWIKTGKVAWDWWNDWNLKGVPFKAGINMDTYKYYIDFAAKSGLQFVILDEGWYDPGSGDMLTVIPELDLPQLVAYAKERGIGIILWTVRKRADNWYVGGLTNWDARDLPLDLSFLPAGKRYHATLFTDGINAEKQAEDYQKQELEMDNTSKLDVHMASGGGFVLKLEAAE